MNNPLYDTKAINDKRIALQREINSNPVKVNREEFVKSAAEKSKLKNLRQFFNRRMQKVYPILTNKNWATKSIRHHCPQTVRICLPKSKPR